MANVSRVNGFRPLNGLGQAMAARLGYYAVLAADATAIYIGDMVKLDGSGDAVGVASVTKATAAGAVIGPVVGVAITPTNLNTPQYRASSIASYVYVADDPNMLFEVQASATLSSADIGLNANLTDAGGSTTTGLSGESLDASSVTTVNTTQFKILGFTQRVDNTQNAASAKVIVKINNHMFVSATGGTGV